MIKGFVPVMQQIDQAFVKNDFIFNSATALYVWSDVADALTKVGVMQATTEASLHADAQAPGAMISTGNRWKEDLGLNILGPFKAISANPATSNSGLIRAALLAISLNAGNTATEADLPVLPTKLQSYFASVGFIKPFPAICSRIF